MGSVTPYATKSGKRYRVRYRRPDGSQTDRRGFTTKRDAEVFLASIELTKADGSFIDSRSGKVTIGELGPTWLDNRRRVIKPSTYLSMESSWRVHVHPRWGDARLADIRHSAVQSWISQMAMAHSATSVLRAHGILAGIMDTAVKDRLISSNPARGISLPRKRRKQRAYLDHASVDLLASQSQYPTLVSFLAYTGLRWGEATALRVRSVDLARLRVTISENAVLVSGDIVIGTPKTHHTRSVPVPPFLIAPMQIAIMRKGPTDFVFGPGDRPLRRPQSDHGWFAIAVRRAQAVQPNFPRITPHDLRHTAASLAVSAGANVKAVQRMLGHASAAMTLDTYSDLFDDDLNAVASALDAARSAQLAAALTAPGADVQ